MASKDNGKAIQLPASDSDIVIKQKQEFFKTLDLEALVDDLGRLGNCVRIAYHAVTGYVELQIEIQRIGYDVTKLCNKSAVTVGRFKDASTTIVSSLQSTYELLLDSFEDMALETLAEVADTAKGMTEAAKTLHHEFNEEADKVIVTLENTMRTKDTEEKAKEKLTQKIKEMEVASEAQEKLAKEAEIAKEKEEELMRQADEKEEAAVQAILDIKDKQERKKEEERLRKENASWFRKFIELFTSNNNSTGEPDPALLSSLRTNEERARAAREERNKHLEKMYEQQNKRSQALAELAEFAKRIQNTKSDETQVEAAIEALHSAVKALKALSAVMLQAAHFWEKLQVYCESLANIKIKNMIEKALEKYSEEKRLKLWKSPAFQNKAIKYYAKWVALDEICTVYTDRIQETQHELHKYIQEALRPEEARSKVRELAQIFLKDLESQQKVIDNRKIAIKADQKKD